MSKQFVVLIVIGLCWGCASTGKVRAPREVSPWATPGGLEADSALFFGEFDHPYVRELDSLALLVEKWPERDTAGDASIEVSPAEDIFPEVMNDRIEFWIRYFTGPGQENFARALYRMELYRPTIEFILGKLELPRDLICLALIESGFNLKARSYARAVGPWQFIPGTAALYGLRVNWWMDERRDIVASTYAAGNYLKDLYAVWDSWPLALAAYNCGEYRVARAVARHKTTDFWKLDLPKQTERYVPKFLAALYIARDSEKYGFRKADVEPLTFDEVTIADATDIKLIAEAAGVDVETVRELNPYLLRWCTPPKSEVRVKVPRGTGKTCRANLESVPPTERVTWRKHTISPGETLFQIASEYQTTVETLKRLNGIRNAHRIRAGHSLIVPLQGPVTELASATTPSYENKRRNISREALEKHAASYGAPANYKKVVYTVKDHDTLGEIAELFRTSARKIRAWNNLSYRSFIYPGQKLAVYVPPTFDVSKVSFYEPEQPSETDYRKTEYIVQRGDSFHSISQKFSVKVIDLLAWNNKSPSTMIRAGEVLEIWTKK